MATVLLANGRSFAASEGQSLLDAAQAAGLVLEHSCKTGRCSSCKARVISGSTTTLRPEEGLSDEDSRAGHILTCVRSATTDVALDIDDLGEVADYPARLWPARIQQLERVAHDVMRITLRLPPTASFRYLAGQYVDVIGPEGLRRAYSVANAPLGAAGPVELHVRAVEGGRMSDYWFNRARPNDLLRIQGPLGTFFLRDAVDDDIVFLATGTGVAPVKAMLEQISRSQASSSTPPQRVTVYWGNRTPGEHYWHPAFEGLDLRFVPVASRAPEGWGGARGHVQDVFLSSEPDLSHTWVYACGSNAMIEAAQRQLAEAGLPAKRFHSDAFVCSS